MNEATALIGATATLMVGVTGLIKIVRLWRQAQRNERVEELEARNASLERLLDDCGEAIRAYERDRWRWREG
jgi:hypothetical protein